MQGAQKVTGFFGHDAPWIYIMISATQKFIQLQRRYHMNSRKVKKIAAILCVATLTAGSLSGCGGTSSSGTSSASGSAAKTSSSSDGTFKKSDSVETVLKAAAAAGSIGDWGNGEQYEILALLNKYGINVSSSDLLNQGFDMSGFDDGSIMLASAMSYNELGLIKNSYDGAYGYGDKIGTIDFNKEGISMVEDNLVCTRDFAEKNPNTVKAFIYGTIQGWKYASEHPDEAAQIVADAGSTLSEDHQKYMAEEMAKLASTKIDGSEVDNYCEMYDDALQQTLDISQKYIKLDDSTAQDALSKMTLDTFRDPSYYNDAKDKNFGTPEKKNVTIQLKWLAQSQFMGYYVALDKGYYKDAGLDVTITPGGGDISEITQVNSGQADFASSWTVQTITADASGMDLIEVAQPTESAGMTMIYKLSD